MSPGYNISTRTVIASTNVEFNIHDIYCSLPALELDKEHYEKYTRLIPTKKRRGRRKKSEDDIRALQKDFDDFIDLKPGDIVAIYFRHNKKGLPQYLKYGVKFFRNALNIVMMRNRNKKINMKLSQNGKVQMTGCKDHDDAMFCLRILFEQLEKHCPDHVVYSKDSDGTTLEIQHFTVMTNLDFDIGFHINRQKLNNLINGKTLFNSLLETSFGYTGVNIKIEVPYDPDCTIDTMRCLRSQSSCQQQTIWEYGHMRYEDYLKRYGEHYYAHEKDKQRYNTFLVFHSGKIIMSGMRLDRMLDHFKEFCQFLLENRDHIEETMI